jgi:lipid II:glycine glycyltransferase (peptidoglycan interpeptide bridge formation enzyme)
MVLTLSDSVSFTQSWEWGELVRREGKEVDRICIKHAGEIIFCAQIFYYPLFLGTYAFSPKGPVVRLDFQKKITDAYKLLTDYLKKKKCLFWRLEPHHSVENLEKIMKFKKVIDINPRTTTIANLMVSDEELLARMHSKTRYNIRLAEKKNLVISYEKNSAVFMKLMEETGVRDGFRLHAKKHYEYILSSSIAEQITLWHESTPVAVGVFIPFGKTYTYLFGASNYELRNVMAPHLIQWEGMKLGKKHGCSRYDFFGIAPSINSTKEEGVEKSDEHQYDPKHQYSGVTRFKLGFGGSVVEEAGTFDIRIRLFFYKLYEAVRTIRRLF